MRAKATREETLWVPGLSPSKAPGCLPCAPQRGMSDSTTRAGLRSSRGPYNILSPFFATRWLTSLKLSFPLDRHEITGPVLSKLDCTLLFLRNMTSFPDPRLPLGLLLSPAFLGSYSQVAQNQSLPLPFSHLLLVLTVSQLYCSGILLSLSFVFLFNL